MSSVLFWVAFLGLFYSAIGYPATLWLIRRFAQQHVRLDRDLLIPVSIFIPAYNEEAVIRAKMENTLAFDYPRELMEIVVASESNDATNAIVSEYKEQGVRLISYPGHRGKSFLIHDTVPELHNEVIVFSDANAMLRPDAIHKLVRNFADERIGCVSGLLIYESSADSAPDSTETAYWRYETWVRRLESAWMHLLGANGALFALRRGCYQPLSKARCDDFELAVQTLIADKGVILEPEAIAVEKTAISDKHEFSRHQRMAGWMFLSTCMLTCQAAKRLKLEVLWQLISHKLVRWWGLPLFLVLVLTTALHHSTLFQVLLLGEFASVLFALIGLAAELFGFRAPRVCRWSYCYFLLLTAAFVGILKSVVVPARPAWEKVR